jgi:hypothetical protein
MSNEPEKKLKNGCLVKTMGNHWKMHGDLSEKALLVWIKSIWKFKGEISLKLRSKGFFTAIFTCSEDKNTIFDEGPYLLNFVGLHLKYWSEHFSLENEDFTVTPVWIRLYSLPQELSHLENMEGL